MASAEVLRAEEKVPLKEPLEFSELTPGATSSQGNGFWVSVLVFDLVLCPFTKLFIRSFVWK